MQFHSYGLFPKILCGVRFPLQEGGGLGSPLPWTYISIFTNFFFPIISYPYLSFPDQLYYWFCTMLCLLRKRLRGQGVLQDKWSIVLGHEALCYFKILVFGTLHFKNFKFFQIMITSSECSRPVRFFGAKFSILGKLVNEL